MRRFFLLFFVAVLLALPTMALAEAFMNASTAIFEAFEAMSLPGETERTDFGQVGNWVSVVLQKREADGLRFYALVYDIEEEAFVTWDDLFLDGDAAADRIVEMAMEATYQNAYAENNQLTPVPRDNFRVQEGVLTVYYPADQHSYFSGRAGAVSFYAYELAGLLKENVPLNTGAIYGAVQTKQDVFAQGALPEPLGSWKIGGAMADAADVLGLVDVPDLTYEFSVYRFEAPEMRGIALLSGTTEDRVQTATIGGIYAERMDLGGLITGISTRVECIEALGEPDLEMEIATADAYSLRPVGETLCWEENGRVLELHFVEGILQSVLLR